MYKSLYDSFRHWYRTDGVHENSIWIFSDPHFGDPDMKKLRPNNIEDDELVKMINSVVGKHDTLICLGDVGDINYVKKLRGYKVLVTGNHDRGASYYKREKTRVKKLFAIPNSKELPYTAEEYMNSAKIRSQVLSEYPDTEYVVSRVVHVDNHLFDEVYEGPVMIGPKIVLSHEPLGWRYVLNLHGHDHWKIFETENPHINLCVEHNGYMPVLLKDIIESGILSTFDDIHRVTIDEATERSKNPQSNV